MNINPSRIIKAGWRAPLFSPAGLLARAVLITVVWAACELSGMREYTTFLSGTQKTAWNTTVWLGLTYLVAYQAFVILAPILTIAAGLLAGIERWSRR